MYRIISLLVCATLLFSGCVDIFIDVVQNPNGSFTLRKMMSIDDSVLTMLQSFQSSMGDTSKITRRVMLDTMESQFAWEHDSLLTHKEIKWYVTRDSQANGTTFILSEISVDNLATLSLGANALFRTFDSKRHDPDPESSRLVLNCKTNKKGTSLQFYFTPNKAPKTKDDLKMAKQFLGDHSLHIRVFSPNLAVTRAKDIYPMSNGQQWITPLTSLIDNKSIAKVKATFFLSGVK